MVLTCPCQERWLKDYVWLNEENKDNDYSPFCENYLASFLASFTLLQFRLSRTMLYRFSFLALAAQVALAAINVNVGTTYQTMDGFGFSQAFGRANDLYNLPTTQRSHALDLLFSPTAGAGFTILRNRIGSGGSGDSIEPTSPGSPSGTPKYVWDGSDSHQVWVSQQAKAYGVTRFYANAWSAPGFMKTNGKETNGGYLCGMTGESCSSGDWMQAYAEFLIQYIKYYSSVGIDYKYLGFLNEPDYT